MNKIKLYVDFDGVILDTISETYKMIEEKKLITTKEIDNFYKTLDWKKLINNTPIFKDSINCIKKIIDSNRFEVRILTHVQTKNEIEEKIKFIRNNNINVDILPCPREIPKSDYVDPKDAILVDDYTGNLELWHEKGGIPIKFSDKGKSGKYKTITKLDQILDINFSKEVIEDGVYKYKR